MTLQKLLHSGSRRNTLIVKWLFSGWKRGHPNWNPRFSRWRNGAGNIAWQFQTFCYLHSDYYISLQWVIFFSGRKQHDANNHWSVSRRRHLLGIALGNHNNWNYCQKETAHNHKKRHRRGLILNWLVFFSDYKRRNTNNLNSNAPFFGNWKGKVRNRLSVIRIKDFLITSYFIIRSIQTVCMPDEFTLIFVKTNTLSR